MTHPMEYKVEKILRTKVKGNEVFYVVKWEGFEELTEEPETNSDIRALVDELWSDNVAKMVLEKSAATATSQKVLGLIMKTSNEHNDVKRMKFIKKRHDEGARSSKPKRAREIESQSQFDPRDCGDSEVFAEEE